MTATSLHASVPVIILERNTSIFSYSLRVLLSYRHEAILADAEQVIQTLLTFVTRKYCHMWVSLSGIKSEGPKLPLPDVKNIRSNIELYV